MKIQDTTVVVGAGVVGGGGLTLQAVTDGMSFALSANNSSWRNTTGSSDVAASINDVGDAGFTVRNSATTTDNNLHAIHITASARL